MDWVDQVFQALILKAKNAKIHIENEPQGPNYRGLRWKKEDLLSVRQFEGGFRIAWLASDGSLHNCSVNEANKADVLEEKADVVFERILSETNT